MGYKKIYSRPPINVTTTASAPAYKTYLNQIVSEFALAGVTRTTDTGQLNIETITPVSGALTNMGYLMFKVYDDVFLKLEVIINSFSTATYHSATLKPSVGSMTDGGGNFVGNNVAFSDYGYKVLTGNSGPEHISQYSTIGYNDALYSYIYKSEKTFWVSLDYNRASSTTGYKYPGLFIMINKSVDAMLNLTNEYVSVMCNDNRGATPGTGGFQSMAQVSVKAFSTTEINELNESVNCPSWGTTTIDNEFNVVCRRNFNPFINKRVDVNYDVLTIRPEYFNALQEFKVVNGGNIERNYIAFSRGTLAVDTTLCQLRLTTSTNDVAALIWD